MFKEKTVKELTEDLLIDIQQKVGYKINMNKLMWRLYEQAKHIAENSDKKYHNLAALYHIADEGNRAYLLVNTTVDFSVTSYDFLVNTIHFGYNLPVIIRDQDLADIMTYLVYVHARNIGYDHFVPGDKNDLEEIDMVFAEVEVKPVSARRIAKGATRREELIENESTARRLKEENLSNADIAEQLDINELSVRVLLDPLHKAKDDVLVNNELDNVRRRINDAKRRKELVEKVQWYTLYGLGAVLLLSIGLIIYTHIFNS